MKKYFPEFQRHSVAIWLFTCCFFIFLMVSIGGVTRLTHSGLSITEWKPVSGVVPPFSDGSWHEEFAKYQQSPEYLKNNPDMSLQEFKGIFWLEFIHRLAGRITGFVFLLPMVYFIAKKQLCLAFKLRLGGILTLIATQGLVGWYMVKSGLRDDPHVSQYWLAFHLGMAFLIYGFVLWNGLNEIRSAKLEVEIMSQSNNSKLLFFTSSFIVLFTFFQVIIGAFVAGSHAGLVYNSFPDMGGQFVPEGLFVMSPWYINFFENTTTIQFTHRIFAYFITTIILFFRVVSCKFSLTLELKYAINTLVLALALQIFLGIATILYQVPVILASLHQISALLLFTVIIFITHELGRGFIRSKK